MDDHPLRSSQGRNLEYLRRCHFVFNGVGSSKRSVTSYVGDPKFGVFGTEHTEVDGPFLQKRVLMNMHLKDVSNIRRLGLTGLLELKDSC